MKKTIFHSFFIIHLLFLLYSCNQTSQFTVSGIVAGANGDTIYLENIGLSSTIVLDSMKLNSSGKFSFKQAQPDFPDFYRLRLNNQLINFAIDSTENISIIADAGTFATSYNIEGSENCIAIKEITLSQLDAIQQLKRLRKEYDEKLISDTTYQLYMSEAINNYKNVAKKYIYTKPMSTAAYYALFQQIDGLLFFDLYDKNDSRAFGAVATSYNHFYPESPRAKHLYQLALQSLKVVRSERILNLDHLVSNEIDFLEIELPDKLGKNIKLSDISKDKVVILNFTVFQTEWSLNFNQILSKLYTDYHAKGLEIYQISLDNDIHFWKNIATNLPWICVHDPQSVYSQSAAMYNVKQLPTVFLLDQKGRLIKRIDDVNKIEQEVRRLF